MFSTYKRKDNKYYTRKGQVIRARRPDQFGGRIIDNTLIPIYIEYALKNNLIPSQPTPVPVTYKMPLNFLQSIDFNFGGASYYSGFDTSFELDYSNGIEEFYYNNSRRHEFKAVNTNYYLVAEIMNIFVYQTEQKYYSLPSIVFNLYKFCIFHSQGAVDTRIDFANLPYPQDYINLVNEYRKEGTVSICSIRTHAVTSAQIVPSPIPEMQISQDFKYNNMMDSFSVISFSEDDYIDVTGEIDPVYVTQEGIVASTIQKFYCTKYSRKLFSNIQNN